MTTVLEAFRARAFAEFDEIIAERERLFRLAQRAEGRGEAEIDHMIGNTQRALAAQRALIPGNVAIELMKAGVPLDHEVDA